MIVKKPCDARRSWRYTQVETGVVFRKSLVDAVQLAVAGSMWLTILSDMVFRQWSLNGGMVGLTSLQDRVPALDVGMARAADVEWNSAVTAFRKFMHLGDA